MLVHADPLGPGFKWQIFGKLETAQPQENSPVKTESVGDRLQGVDRVLKGPKGTMKKLIKELMCQRKQNAHPPVENTAKEVELRRLSPRKLEQLHMMQRPRKSVGSSFNTKPSFLNGHKASVSSSLPSGSTPPKSEVKHESKDLAYTILEDADTRVRNMEVSEPPSHPRKKHFFLGTRSHAQIIPGQKEPQFEKERATQENICK